MYSLTIIGGGAISCGYDSPKDKNILTHIHGALKHHKIKLNNIVEIDKKQQQNIRDKWGDNLKIYSNLEDSLENTKSDIIIVATPTNTHLKIIKDIFNIYEPKLIICEKPTVSSLDEFNKLIQIFDNKSTKIITNFIRRFDPIYNELKKFIKNDTNETYHFYGTFTKGLMHNGSHLIDLISMLIGKINSVEAIEKQIINNDIFGKFLITTAKATGIITNINRDELASFDFIIYTDTSKIEIQGANENIVIHHIENSTRFKNYKSYLRKERFIKTIDNYGLHTLNFAIKVIEDDDLYNITKKEQIEVNNMIFKITP